ncbi:MAG TPA: SDR family oxidoreductase [Planctomycetota bacterium]|nr:SDR family oxidoreductase [Planctomycetota bacterium]
MPHGPRLLVTGASGFLGAHVASLAPRTWSLIAHVHRSPLPTTETAVVAGADLASERELEALLDAHTPRAIVHTAACSRIADCERDPSAATRVNVEATARLARWCAEHGARFVHVSTDLVFGAVPAPDGGFREHDATAPLSSYGHSKLEAEHAVLAADPRAAIARLPLLIGPSHGRGLGATDSVLAALLRGETPSLFEDEWRTPLDVRSAAEALLELAANDLAGVLHVAGPERLSRFDIGLRALRQTGLRDDQARAKLVRTTREAVGQAHRPRDVSLDSSRARSLLSTLLIGLESGST